MLFRRKIPKTDIMENTAKLKFRMYFFVPYNVSPIQQAIQAGHAALDYVRRFGLTENLMSFLENDKTWIILNGGTTNSSLDENDKPLGTLDLLHEELWAADIDHSIFHEPDLNNALTAICFLADERVWDYTVYPEFYDWLLTIEMIPASKYAFDFASERKWNSDQLKENFSEYYNRWVHEVLGGEKNEFLRNLTRGKKLA
jgi:hypothetical protein